MKKKKLKAIEQYSYFIFHERALEVLKVLNSHSSLDSDNSLSQYLRNKIITTKSLGNCREPRVEKVLQD